MGSLLFTRGAATLRLPPHEFPAQDRVESGVVLARAADGTTLTERKAPAQTILIRRFSQVRDADYAALKNWYLTEAQGATNTFTATEPDGASYTVRWLDETLDWRRDDRNRWSGTLTLRVEA